MTLVPDLVLSGKNVSHIAHLGQPGTCSTCPAKFVVPPTNTMLCRMNPPTPLAIHGPQGTQIAPAWPPVLPDSSCMQHPYHQARLRKMVNDRAGIAAA